MCLLAFLDFCGLCRWLWPWQPQLVTPWFEIRVSNPLMHSWSCSPALLVECHYWCRISRPQLHRSFHQFWKHPCFWASCVIVFPCLTLCCPVSHFGRWGWFSSIIGRSTPFPRWSMTRFDGFGYLTLRAMRKFGDLYMTLCQIQQREYANCIKEVDSLDEFLPALEVLCTLFAFCGNLEQSGSPWWSPNGFSVLYSLLLFVQRSAWQLVYGILLCSFLLHMINQSSTTIACEVILN